MNKTHRVIQSTARTDKFIGSAARLGETRVNLSKILGPFFVCVKLGGRASQLGKNDSLAARFKISEVCAHILN